MKIGESISNNQIFILTSPEPLTTGSIDWWIWCQLAPLAYNAVEYKCVRLCSLFISLWIIFNRSCHVYCLTFLTFYCGCANGTNQFIRIYHQNWRNWFKMYKKLSNETIKICTRNNCVDWFDIVCAMKTVCKVRIIC